MQNGEIASKYPRLRLEAMYWRLDGYRNMKGAKHCIYKLFSGRKKKNKKNYTIYFGCIKTFYTCKKLLVMFYKYCSQK